MKGTITVALASLLLAACGGGATQSRDAGTQTDVREKLDAQKDAPSQKDSAPADTAPEPCGIEAELGDLGAVAGQTDLAPQTPPTEYVGWLGAINNDPDAVDLELYKGAGVFQTAITTGTFTLSGAETNYRDCGLCVLLWSDVSQSAKQYYMATGGTVDLTSVTGRLTGTLTNVTFTHVTINETTYESTPVNDGCDATITSMSFDSPIETVGDGGVADGN